MLLVFRKAILAGIFIALGGVINLKVGGPLGAFLFSFGLLSVVHYSLPLFTGKAGFCKYSQDIKILPLILLGNILGTFLVGICVHYVYPDLVEKAISITTQRQYADILPAFFCSFMCGLIMTTVVKFAREKKFIPLLIGIPLFILAGFWHSIADAFYYSLSLQFSLSFLYIYPITVLGNYVGCNGYNLLVTGSLFEKTEEI